MTILDFIDKEEERHFREWLRTHPDGTLQEFCWATSSRTVEENERIAENNRKQSVEK